MDIFLKFFFQQKKGISITIYAITINVLDRGFFCCCVFYQNFFLSYGFFMLITGWSGQRSFLFISEYCDLFSKQITPKTSLMILLFFLLPFMKISEKNKK